MRTAVISPRKFPATIVSLRGRNGARLPCGASRCASNMM